MGGRRRNAASFFKVGRRLWAGFYWIKKKKKKKHREWDIIVDEA